MKTIAEETMVEWTKEEKERINSVYGCELIYENATPDQIKDTSVPNDAYLVYYEVAGENYVDVCRGRKRVDFRKLPFLILKLYVQSNQKIADVYVTTACCNMHSKGAMVGFALT